MIICSHIKGKIVFRRCHRRRRRRWAYIDNCGRHRRANLRKQMSSLLGLYLFNAFCFSSDQRRRPWTLENRKWRREREATERIPYKVIRVAIKEIENKKVFRALMKFTSDLRAAPTGANSCDFLFSLGAGGIFVLSRARISRSHATCLPLLVQEQLKFVRYTVRCYRSLSLPHPPAPEEKKTPARVFRATKNK